MHEIVEGESHSVKDKGNKPYLMEDGICWKQSQNIQ